RSAYANDMMGFHISLPVAHFTLVAMCGLMAGVQHSPLSAIFLIAEITGGYELFVPLMFVSAIAYTTSTHFEKDSIYKRQLKDQGKHLPETKDQELLDTITIVHVIERYLLHIHTDAQLEHRIDLVNISKRNILPVVDEKGPLCGKITLHDFRGIMFNTENQENVRLRQPMQSPPE